jgi:hypothetical protein
MAQAANPKEVLRTISPAEVNDPVVFIPRHTSPQEKLADGATSLVIKFRLAGVWL